MDTLQTTPTPARRAGRSAAAITAVLAMTGLVLAGCSSSSKSSSVATAAPVSQAPAPAATAPPSTSAAPTTAATAPVSTVPAAASTVPAAASTVPATTSAGAGPPAPATGSSPAAPIPVTATEKEYVITLSRTTLTPGTYIFTIKNVGMFKHDLVFNGPGLTDVGSALVLPGSTGSLTVTLQAGTYDVFCGVPTHKAKGMDLHVTVA